MSLLTFGKDKPVFDQTTLNKFIDMFMDYKEKIAGDPEFFLDLSKELQIEKYSISERELVHFFSKVQDENAMVLYESEFNEILISFDQSFADRVSVRQNLKETHHFGFEDTFNSLNRQKMNTILD